VVKVLRSIVDGPLVPFVSGFAEELLHQGYTRTSAEQHVCFIAQLDRWMLAEGVGLGELGASVIEGYLAERRAAGYVQYRSARAMRPLLEFLRPLGVLPDPEEEIPLGPVEVLLNRYEQYLLTERGLTPATVRGYVRVVSPFVQGRCRGDRLDLAALTAADVTGYVLAWCPGRAGDSAKSVVCALRSLLRWLHLTGMVPVSLAPSVPSVAGWKLAGLPKGLEPGQLPRLLAACDRRTATGRRDYAIVLMLARLGLRAGEVAGLGLDDIDWHRGEILVVGKGRRAERLPLPQDVGEALTGYLRRGRPSSAPGRSVFIRVKAPQGPLSSGGVSGVVHDAAKRAGLGVMHAHRLRHTAATAMLRAGSPLAEVGQVLRHRSALTTAIYAKVDRDALAGLAWPWPSIPTGGRS